MKAILLAGGPVGSDLEGQIGLPTWRFPIADGLDIRGAWWGQISVAASRCGMELRDSVLLASAAPDLSKEEALSSGNGGFRVVRDTGGHRGTAGVVADEVRGERGCDCGWVLLAEASACPSVDLGGLLAEVCSLDPGMNKVVLGMSGKGRYAGVAVCTAGVFRSVPTAGYCDFKEQLLPKVLDAGGSIEAVKIVDRARRIRSRPEWLLAVRSWRRGAENPLAVNDVGSDWRGDWGGSGLVSRSSCTFGATVVSSIVMDGAIVEPGAVVARSVVGPGARVRSGMRVTDSVVAGAAG